MAGGELPGAGARAGSEVGRPPVLPSRRRERRKRWALAGMAPGAPAALLGLSAGPLTRRDHSAPQQPARVSSNSPSLPRFFLRPSPPPLARPHPPAFLCPAIPHSRWGNGLGTGLWGAGGLRRGTARREGREGLSECRYPSAAATRAHVTRPPPRLPPALLPADPHRGFSWPILTPIPRGCPPTRPIPRVSPDPPSHQPPGSVPAHPHTNPQGISLPFPTAARWCPGDAPSAPRASRRSED